MSANIDSMAYTNRTPWHGLGSKLDGDPDTLTMLKRSGLDWRVELTPSLTEVYGELEEVPQENVVTRLDTSQPLATVGERYEPIQNKELFKIADSVVNETEATYETAGALGRGEVVFVLLQFPEPIDVEGDPEGRIEKYFLIRSSHDGSSALDTRFCATRVVCQNTMNVALNGTEASFSIRHTSSAEKQIGRVKKSLEAAAQYYDNLEEILTAWTRRPMDLHTFIFEVADELFPADDDGERSGKAKADRERLIDLFEDGCGMNSSIQETKYAGLQALIEFADHMKTFRASDRYDRDEARFRSIIDGSSARFKRRGYQLIKAA